MRTRNTSSPATRSVEEALRAAGDDLTASEERAIELAAAAWPYIGAGAVAGFLAVVLAMTWIAGIFS